MVVLRDGRKMVGVLRSWDQFGMDPLFVRGYQEEDGLTQLSQPTSSSKGPSNVYLYLQGPSLTLAPQTSLAGYTPILHAALS